MRLVNFLLYSLLGIALVWWQPGEPQGWLLLNAVLFDLCGFISALVHELGHAFAAKSVGMRVFMHRLLGNYPSDGKQLLKVLRPDEVYIDKALEEAFVAEFVYADSLNDYIHAENVCRSGLARYPESKMLANGLPELE